MHQLQTDAAEIFGTVAATWECIKNTWSKTNLDSDKPKLLRTRELGVTWLNPECNRKFAEITEGNCHMCIAQMMFNNNDIVDESQPFVCPITSCNMRYRRKGWFTRHITQCHQASEEASTLSSIRQEMILHCYSMHLFFVLKGMFIKEVRSSESRLGLLGSGPQWVMAWVNSLQRSCWP